MKHVIKDFLFVIIFFILFYLCTNVFILKGNTYGSDVISFYEEEKNSLDVMFFGSSHSYATFSPYIIKEETGLDSYNFATQQQPLYITYHYMLEALKTQKPKYFVLELHMLSIDDKYMPEGVVRDALDKMHFSKNKVEAIKVSVKNKKDRLSYYLNLIKYHSRYKELTLSEIKNGLLKKGINNKGFKYLDVKPTIKVDNIEALKDVEIKEPSSKNLEYLKKIVHLVESNDIQLIFVKSPCELKNDEQKYLNWAKQYAEEEYVEYINYNELFDELGLKEGDFYDKGHLSGEGAKKVSIHFSNYINKKNKTK